MIVQKLRRDKVIRWLQQANWYEPIRGQYSRHVTETNQSEHSARPAPDLIWSTNQLNVFTSTLTVTPVCVRYYHSIWIPLKIQVLSIVNIWLSTTAHTDTFIHIFESLRIYIIYWCNNIYNINIKISHSLTAGNLIKSVLKCSINK